METKTMEIKFIDFSQQYETIKEEVDVGIKKVFERGDFILGKEEKEFESEFSKFCEAKYAIGVNSGTDALYLGLAALNIELGDEVILPSFTFIATALAVSYTGAKPVFVDIEPDTYNIDPEKFKAAITEKTKAVIPVHIYGQAANMDEILAIARENNIAVMEDAAQAHGAKYKEKRIGSIGDIACFSFYPTKGMGAFGDAGMIVTNSEEVYEKAQMLRDYGRKGRYEHKIKGYNSRLDTIQAVVLLAKLKHLDKWNAMRADNAKLYAENLKGIESIQTPIIKEDRSHVFQTFAIRVKNRDKIYEALRNNNIGALIHYPIPLHLQEAYSELNYKKGDFPVAEEFANETLSLPMYPHMEKDQVNYVCEKLKELI